MRLHRRSVRLRAHDYRGGLYFVTVCTHGRQRLFGEVVDGEMVLSAAGRLARDEWLRTAAVRPDAILDAFVVMPDHVHLLFGIVPEDDEPRSGRGSRVGDGPSRDDGTPRDDGPPRRGIPPVCPYRDASVRRFGDIQSGTVASIMRQYKSIVTKRIWATLGREIGPVWQRSFHDRVVRTGHEAAALRRYIADNPARWDPDADRADGHRA